LLEERNLCTDTPLKMHCGGHGYRGMG